MDPNENADRRFRHINLTDQNTFVNIREDPTLYPFPTKSNHTIMAELEITPEEEAVAEAADTNEANNPLESQEQPSPSSSSSPDDVDNPDPEAFINSGLQKWKAAREVWCGISNATAREEPSFCLNSDNYKKAVVIDVDGVIDVLFDPRWRGGGGARGKASLVPPRFPANVPLPQMIDILTDLWEAEGLDV